MSTWKYVIFSAILLLIGLTGCGESTDGYEQDSPSSESKESEETKEQRTNFGDDAIEADHFVAYLKPNRDLYIYNHDTEDEFKVHENIKKFDVFENYVLFIVEEGMTSELDISLETIYRTNMETEETEKMVDSSEEEDYYTTPRDFIINNNGYFALTKEIGYFYSNFWYDYTATTIDFSLEEPIVTLSDSYDSILNNIQWQNNHIFLLVHKNEMIEDDQLHTELRSFSIEDGEQMIQEKALPLSEKEFNELFDHTVYIGVEDSVLYMSGVDDDDVEQIAYEIDLDTHEVIHQTP